MNEPFDSPKNRGSNATNNESIEMKVVTNALDKAYGIKRSSSGSSVTEMDRKSGQTTNGSDSKCQYFQKRKEKSAKILITIVVTFLICHTFRFVFKVYEVISPSNSLPEHHQYCSEQKRYTHLIRKKTRPINTGGRNWGCRGCFSTPIFWGFIE